MYNYMNYLRKTDIQEARLPLLINIIKYCVKRHETSQYDLKDYHFEADQEKGLVKISFTPDSIAERAYILVKATIEEEWQLHESMDWYDVIYYAFDDIQIIEARYHRYNDSMSDEENIAKEYLSTEELNSVELNDLITEGLTEGHCFKESDKVTGVTHYNYELGLSFLNEEFEDCPRS